MYSPFSHLSFDVSTAHEYTIYRVNFTFVQTLNSLGEALEMRMKSGLTLRLTLYSADVQRTFMLTYVLFMVVIQCPFPKFADGLGI